MQVARTRQTDDKVVMIQFDVLNGNCYGTMGIPFVNVESPHRHYCHTTTCVQRCQPPHISSTNAGYAEIDITASLGKLHESLVFLIPIPFGLLLV